MTRKDYVKIAALLRAHTEDPNVPVLVSGFANMLQDDNPSFDRHAFLTAVYGVKR
jgi:hypothetical protein